METEQKQTGAAGSRDAVGADTALAKNFKEFWPLYLSQHSNPKTRLWHYCGTIAGLCAGALVFGFQYARNSMLESLILALFAEIVVSYGVLFVSHWVIEGNQPATMRALGKQRMQIVKELWWSVVGDFRMLWLALNEQIPNELQKHGLISKAH